MRIKHQGIFHLIFLALCFAGCQQLPTQNQNKTMPQASKTEFVWHPDAQNAFIRGNSLRNTKPEEALNEYERCVTIDAKMEPCWFNYLKLAAERAVAASQLADIYQRLDQAQVTSARIENLRGVLLVKQGKIKRARVAFEKALQLDPSSISATRNLAILLDIYLDEKREALRLYEKLDRLLAASGLTEPRLAGWIADLKNRM